MVTVKIDENVLLDLLMDRVEYWTSDSDTLELFKSYYKDMIECGGCEDMELDINVIVDNDYINYFKVMETDDPDYAWAMENEDRIHGRLDNGTILVYMA